jgi:hypothetical protein
MPPPPLLLGHGIEFSERLLYGREATIHAIRRLTDRKAFRRTGGNLLGAPRCMPLQSVSSRRNDAGRYCRHPDGIGAIKLEAAPRYHLQRFASLCARVQRP